MKKILSALLAAIMILSVMSVSAFVVSATPATHTLDAKNVGIDVPYFSGTTVFYEIGGKTTDDVKTVDEWGTINHAVKKGEGVLNLDGTITEEEWGNPIISLRSDKAATIGGKTPSAENTFYWLKKKGTAADVSAVTEKGLNLDVWMAWDEDFLYVAAIVDDPDKPFANKPGPDIWDGDTLQFIIDPDGPNSIVDGSGYSADTNPVPWKTMGRTGGGWKGGGKIVNIGVAYVTEGKFGSPRIYDMAPRYNPVRSAVTDAEGNIDYWTTNWTGEEIDWLYFQDGDAGSNEIMDTDNYYGAFAAVLPQNLGTRTNQIWQTTYEVAIPWTLVSGSYYEFVSEGEVSEDEEGTFTKVLHKVDPDVKAGDEYGFSLGLLNGNIGMSEYNSWITWGSGIFRAQTDGTEFVTAGGSNSMVLSADELGTIAVNGTAAHKHTFEDATCESPEKCSVCGYERGFATGHWYEHTVVSPLSQTQDGVIRSTCKWCNDTYDTTVEHGTDSAYFTLNKGATMPIGADNSPNNELSTGWNYSYKEQKTDPDTGKLVDTDTPVFNADGSMKTSWTSVDGEMVFDFSDHRAGTYFETRTSRKSYSAKYSFKLTDTSKWGDDETVGYTAGFYNWFGGKQAGLGRFDYGMNYAAGFFPDSFGSTTGKFKIMDAVGMVLKNSTTQRVYAETETIDLGTDWHDVIFVYDESAGAAFFYLDGECILGAAEEGMKMPGGDQVPLMRRIDVPLMVTNNALGGTRAFLAESYNVPATDGYTVTCDGEVIGTYQAGEVVSLPSLDNATIDGGDSRFFTWEGADVVRSDYSSANGTANGRVYTLTMPAENVTLTSVYVLVGDVNQDSRLNLGDLAAIKKLLAGATMNDIQAEAVDVNADGRDNLGDLADIKKLLAGA